MTNCSNIFVITYNIRLVQQTDYVQTPSSALISTSCPVKKKINKFLDVNFKQQNKNFKNFNSYTFYSPYSYLYIFIYLL